MSENVYDEQRILAEAGYRWVWSGRPDSWRMPGTTWLADWDEVDGKPVPRPGEVVKVDWARDRNFEGEDGWCDIIHYRLPDGSIETTNEAHHSHSSGYRLVVVEQYFKLAQPWAIDWTDKNILLSFDVLTEDGWEDNVFLLRWLPDRLKYVLVGSYTGDELFEYESPAMLAWLEQKCLQDIDNYDESYRSVEVNPRWERSAEQVESEAYFKLGQMEDSVCLGIVSALERNPSGYTDTAWEVLFYEQRQVITVERQVPLASDERDPDDTILEVEVSRVGNLRELEEFLKVFFLRSGFRTIEIEWLPSGSEPWQKQRAQDQYFKLAVDRRTLLKQIGGLVGSTILPTDALESLAKSVPVADVAKIVIPPLMNSQKYWTRRNLALCNLLAAVDNPSGAEDEKTYQYQLEEAKSFLPPSFRRKVEQLSLADQLRYSGAYLSQDVPAEDVLSSMESHAHWDVNHGDCPRTLPEYGQAIVSKMREYLKTWNAVVPTPIEFSPEQIAKTMQGAEDCFDRLSFNQENVQSKQDPNDQDTDQTLDNAKGTNATVDDSWGEPLHAPATFPRNRWEWFASTNDKSLSKGDRVEFRYLPFMTRLNGRRATVIGPCSMPFDSNPDRWLLLLDDPSPYSNLNSDTLAEVYKRYPETRQMDTNRLHIEARAGTGRFDPRYLWKVDEERVQQEQYFKLAAGRPKQLLARFEVTSGKPLLFVSTHDAFGNLMYQLLEEERRVIGSGGFRDRDTALEWAKELTRRYGYTLTNVVLLDEASAYFKLAQAERVYVDDLVPGDVIDNVEEYDGYGPYVVLDKGRNVFGPWITYRGPNGKEETRHYEGKGNLVPVKPRLTAYFRQAQTEELDSYGTPTQTKDLKVGDRIWLGYRDDADEPSYARIDKITRNSSTQTPSYDLVLTKELDGMRLDWSEIYYDWMYQVAEENDQESYFKLSQTEGEVQVGQQWTDPHLKKTYLVLEITEPTFTGNRYVKLKCPNGDIEVRRLIKPIEHTRPNRLTPQLVYSSMDNAQARLADTVAKLRKGVADNVLKSFALCGGVAFDAQTSQLVPEDINDIDFLVELSDDELASERFYFGWVEENGFVWTQLDGEFCTPDAKIDCFVADMDPTPNSSKRLARAVEQEVLGVRVPVLTVDDIASRYREISRGNSKQDKIQARLSRVAR